jgi:hydrogenase/urease accessory protein HupE
MSQFKTYFGLGLDHILDIQGYDHILFIVALCAIYNYNDWKRLLILVTAFTVGHSITLALATLNLIRVNAPLVEFLIPLTIFITASANILRKSGARNVKLNLNYYFALFFGLIHGLGFSNYLRSLLGKGQNLLVPLLSFNIGIEVGQILIVTGLMIISLIHLGIFNVSQRDWRLVVSAAVGGISITLLLDTYPF